jgi:polyhydroxyalkanoate synthesis regulator phasin
VADAKMPETQLQHLYSYLVERGRIKQLDNFDESVLSIFSRDVLKRIKSEDPQWESMVPAEVAAMIKKHRYFGYREAEMQGAVPVK